MSIKSLLAAAAAAAAAAAGLAVAGPAAAAPQTTTYKPCVSDVQLSAVVGFAAKAFQDGLTGPYSTEVKDGNDDVQEIQIVSGGGAAKGFDDASGNVLVAYCVSASGELMFAGMFDNNGNASLELELELE